jgi:hypothetical protein
MNSWSECLSTFFLLKCFGPVLPAIAIGSIPMAGAADASWESQLFPKKNGRFGTEIVTFAGRQWILDDFSYVGYRLGEQDLGGDPCRRIFPSAR